MIASSQEKPSACRHTMASQQETMQSTSDAFLQQSYAHLKIPWERWLAPLLDTQCLRVSDSWIANGHAMPSNSNGHFEYTHNATTEGHLAS